MVRHLGLPQHGRTSKGPAERGEGIENNRIGGISHCCDRSWEEFRFQTSAKIRNNENGAAPSLLLYEKATTQRGKGFDF